MSAPAPVRPTWYWPRAVLLILAVLAALLAVFHAPVGGGIDLIALSLALGWGAFLVP